LLLLYEQITKMFVELLWTAVQKRDNRRTTYGILEFSVDWPGEDDRKWRVASPP